MSRKSPTQTFVHSTEIELKLAVDADAMSRLRRAPVLASGSGARGRPRQIVTTYYDSPNLDLYRRGAALRIRKERATLTQTLKARRDNGALDRSEWSSKLDTPRLDLDKLSGIDSEFDLNGLDAERLEPIFTSRIRRQTRIIEAIGPDGVKSRVEVAFDSGAVESAHGHIPVSEIELELIDGSVASLYDLAHRIHQVTPVRIEPLTKAERGYALAAGCKTSCRRAKRIAHPTAPRVGDALSAIFRECMTHWTGNEAAAMDGTDPEGVHQMRVGLRRLRAAVAAFGDILSDDTKNWLTEEARWTISALGPARDWDVFAADVLEPLERARPGDADLAILRVAMEAERARAYDQVRELMASPRYTEFRLRLGAWLESGMEPSATISPKAQGLKGSATRFARRVLQTRYRKVCKAGRDIDSRSTAELHKLRLALKKLRYTAEFFAPLFPRARPFQRAMARMQEQLGHLNDLTNVEQRIRELLAQSDIARANEPGLPRAAGMVIGWQERGVGQATESISEGWTAFGAATPYWLKK